MKADFNDYYPRVPEDDDDDELTHADDELIPSDDECITSDTATSSSHQDTHSQPLSSSHPWVQKVSSLTVATTEGEDDEFVVSPIPNDGIIDDTDDDVAEHVGFVTALSNVLSWVLVPMLVPVIGTIMIFALSGLSAAPASSKWIFTGIVFLFTAVIPTVLVLLLKRVGIVHDIGLNGRRERMIPYAIMIIGFAALGWYFNVKGAPVWMVMFFLGGGLAAVINMVVNLRWKISAHAASVAGLVAMLLVLNDRGLPSQPMTWWIVGSIIFSGLLGSARVWLGRHTLMQVLCGYAVGFCSVYILSVLF